jgi:hypothetical protein
MERVPSSRDYEGVGCFLIDETETTMDCSTEGIRGTSPGRSPRRRAAELVTAVVAPYDVGFGMSPMWEMLTEGPGWFTRAFRTRPEAEAWLREEVRRKFGMELPETLSPPE